jgi:acetyltransferase-like isoleucine patch superfamily enzyme
MLIKAISVIVQIALKLRYGKRLSMQNLRQIIRLSTKIHIGNNGFISIGSINVLNNVHISCSSGELSIGNCVSFNRNCIIVCRKKIQIGDNCQFGPNVCIYDHDHLYNENGVSQDQFKCSDIVIGKGCWIGAGCIILRGTHIGENTVIEAGMVVKGNVPANSVVMSSRESRIIPLSFFKGNSVRC